MAKVVRSIIHLPIIFYLTRTCWSGHCGNTDFRSSNGVISTPDYPSKYESYSTCTYNIEVGHNQRIVLTWKTFDVAGYMPYCNDDGDGYVAVYTGCQLVGQPLISKFCSSNMGLPHVIYSRDSCMKIVFKSFSKTGRGFQAYYSTKDMDEPVSTSTCESDKDLYSASGVITSTNWPVPYPKERRECEWDIKSTSSKVIKLNFMDLETGSSFSSCTGYYNDYVRLKGEASRYTSSYSKVYYCGRKQPFSVITRYYKLQIDFNVYASRTPGRGFAVGYVTYTPKGGTTVTSFSKAALAAVVIGAIAIVLCLIFGCRWYKRRTGRRQPPVTSSYIITPKEPENENFYPGMAPPPYSAVVSQPSQGYPAQHPPYQYPHGAAAPPPVPYPGATPYPPVSGYPTSTPGPAGAPYPPTSTVGATIGESSAPPPPGWFPPSSEKAPLNPPGNAPVTYSPSGQSSAPYPPTTAAYAPPPSGMPPPY